MAGKPVANQWKVGAEVSLASHCNKTLKLRVKGQLCIRAIKNIIEAAEKAGQIAVNLKGGPAGSSCDL